MGLMKKNQLGIVSMFHVQTVKSLAVTNSDKFYTFYNLSIG